MSSPKEPPAGQYDRRIEKKVQIERKKDNFAKAGEQQAAMKEMLQSEEALVQPPEPREEAAPVAAFVRERRRDPVEIVIPNGLRVTMAPPKEAIQFRMARIYKKDLNTDESVIYAKAIMYITHINGEMVPLPTDRIQMELTANRLETDGLEMVCQKMIEHFMGVDLDALKKNMLGF